MNKLQLIVLWLAGLLVFGICNSPASGATMEAQLMRRPNLYERVPNCAKYFPANKASPLVGKTLIQIQGLFGPADVNMHEYAYSPNNTKDILIYALYKDDPSAAYIYLKGGKVAKVWIDEFNGTIMQLYGTYINRK
jgi:hypothetical protein